jgi:hypothetical protein
MSALADQWNVMQEFNEQFELFCQELPAGLDLIADKSQLHSIICFNEQKRGKESLLGCCTYYSI